MDLVWKNSNEVLSQQLALTQQIQKIRADLDEVLAGKDSKDNKENKDSSKEREKTGMDASILLVPEDESSIEIRNLRKPGLEDKISSMSFINSFVN